jgi:hypothetical protein
VTNFFHAGSDRPSENMSRRRRERWPVPPRSRSSPRWLAWIAVLLASLFAAPGVRAEPSLPWSTCSEADRFGVATSSWIGDYPVEQLHAGWYSNFNILAFPPRPAGMEYVQTIRLSNDGPSSDRACSACPTWAVLAAVVQGNPGSLWLIGNEPDEVNIQDNVYPDRYAALYHAFYTFLKARDPTCLVGIGAVVQTTPIRRQYLDLILDSYQTQFGSSMPVDVWNIHNYVLREKRDYPGCPDCWGCGVPPGVPQDVGILYDWSEHDRLDPHPVDPTRVGWKQHIIDFRQWMKDRGQQGKPLIITEFGILMWEEHGYDYDRVIAFMQGTFDFLTTATDPDTGYPADGYRLVQAWAWFSLDYRFDLGHEVASNLFDPETQLMSPLGLKYAAYTAPLTMADLQVSRMDLSQPLTGPTGITVTLTVHLSNGGDKASSASVLRLSRQGTSQDLPLPALAPAQSLVTETTWSNLPMQLHQFVAQVDPDDQVSECNEANNQLTRYLCATCDQYLFLPLVFKVPMR